MCDDILDCKEMLMHVPFQSGYQAWRGKMAATESKDSIASELIKLFKRIEYVTTIRPLKEVDTVMIADFDKLDIAQWYELDTSRCFTGKKKLKLNNHCVYEIFASYCGIDKFKIKDLVTKEVSENMLWYKRVSRVMLCWKDTDLRKWLKKQKFKNSGADELCLYALCVIFRRHCIVYMMFQPWCSVDIKPGMRPQVVEETCETKLVFLGDNLFGELCRKPLAMVNPPLVILSEVQEARELYRDTNLMEMYIVHTESSELNRMNANIVREEQSFVADSDVTRILPSQKTVFDSEYMPETKVEEEPLGDNTMYTLTESLGSTLGEISFAVPVKAEPGETIGNVLSTHSPGCQLRVHVRDYMSAHHPDFNSETPTDSYSSDETIIIGHAAETVSEIKTGSQDVTSLHDITAMTNDSESDKVPQALSPGSQEVSPLQTTSQDVTNVSKNVNIHSSQEEMDESSSSQTQSLGSHEVSPLETTSQEETDANKNINIHSSQEVMDEYGGSQDITSPGTVTQDTTDNNVCSQDETVPPENTKQGKIILPDLINEDTSLSLPLMDPIGHSSLIDVPVIGSSHGLEQPSLSDTQANSSGSSSKRSEHIRKQLCSLGFADELFRANQSRYFPVLTPDEDDIEFLNFMDIIDRSCTVSIPNMSMDDIKLEVDHLKSSSPVPSINSESTQSAVLSIETDDERKDPNYGTPIPLTKKRQTKPRPGRKSSATRIAAQKLITKMRSSSKKNSVAGALGGTSKTV